MAFLLNRCIISISLLAKSDDDGPASDPSKITDQQVANFKQKEQPKFKQFLEGKPSRTEFEASVRTEFMNSVSFFDVLKDSVGLFTLLWLFLGVGSAWKIASNG